MAVYRQNPTKPVTFIDHTGISFTKFIAGTAGPELSPDVGFDLPCGVGLTCLGGAAISGGQGTAFDNGDALTAPFSAGAVLMGDMVEFTVDVVSGGSSIYFGNSVIPEASNLQIGITKFRAIMPDPFGANEFRITSIDATPVVYNSCSMKKITGGSSIETATGTITTFENSPTQILNYTGMIWAAPVVATEVVEINYNTGMGNYIDADGVAMPDQIATLTNCADIITTIGAIVDPLNGLILIDPSASLFIIDPNFGA